MTAAPLFYPLTGLTDGVLTPATAAWIGGLALILGLLLWLGGSRFSQALVTLTAVAVGALIGKKLPAWMGWGVDPIGIAFGGAMVLGIGGYIYHRMWVGVGLGLLMAGWAAIATWVVMRPGESWSCPTIAQFDLAVIGKALWDSVPVDLHKVMPWIVGGAGMAGMTLAAIWPRVAGRMFFSMLGLSVVATAGVLMHQASWLKKLLPRGAVAQLVTSAGLVAIGMTVQWWLGPRRLPVTVDRAPADDSGDNDEG